LYGDVAKVVPLVAQFLMYVTPVVFPMPSGGRMAGLIALNPATPLVLTGRSWLTGSETPMLLPFLAVTCSALLLLFLGGVLYRLAMPILIERLNA
jgi:lipopolysaccharide transport system permease protein